MKLTTSKDPCQASDFLGRSKWTAGGPLPSLRLWWLIQVNLNENKTLKKTQP